MEETIPTPTKITKVPAFVDWQLYIDQDMSRKSEQIYLGVVKVLAFVST